MAFSGVHIEFGYGGSKNRSQDAAAPIFAIDGETQSSQQMSSAGTSSISAPVYSSKYGDPVVYIDTSADVYVATGPSPDAVSGPRKLVRAGIPRQWYCSAGDRIAWVLA